MKKIICFICFAFLLSVISINNISAVSNTCEYDSGLKVTFDEGGTASINQSFYKEKKIPYILNAFYNYNSGSIDSTDRLQFQMKELFGSCPSNLYVCKYEESSLESGLANLFSDEHGRINIINKVYLFYSEGEMKENSTLKDLENDKVEYGSEFVDAVTEGYEACSGYGIVVLEQITGSLCAVGNEVWKILKSTWTAEDFYIKYKNCFNSKYTGDGPTYNLACPKLNVYLGYFNEAINNYKGCAKNDAVCMSKAITAVNEKEGLIKSYCKAILENYDFDKGKDQEGNEQACIEACLDIAVQTKKAKVSAGLMSGDSGECGFSGRLLVWLSNILRWIKYILPVIVIVMGILDFIKAIAAGKDDEMKKAQGNFTKRLIAAALVFLIPLIIEFVLDKMGFGYNDCGLF